MNSNRQFAIATFAGMVVVFLYLLLTPALSTTNIPFVSLFGAIFKYGLNADYVSIIFLRVVLLFFGMFSLTWLAQAMLRPLRS